MIVYIGDNPLINTGMGKVSYGILKALAEKYPTEQIFALVRYPSLNQETNLPDNIVLVIIPAVRDINESRDFIINFLIQNQSKTKFILVQGDIFYFKFLSILRRSGYTVPVYGYLNLDAEDIPISQMETLTCFNKIIFPAEFPVRELKKIGLNNIPYEIIPHGLSDKFIVRTSNEIVKYNKLTFITVANNILRKNLKTLIKAMGELVNKNYNNFNWIIISHFKGETDLFAESIYYDVFNNTFFYENLSDEEVANLMRNSHYLVLSSFGEGFCLPIIEAISQKTPCILPNNTVFKDVAKDCALYYNSDGYIQTFNSFMFSVPSYKSLVNTLIKVYEDFYYNDQKLYKKLLNAITEYQNKHLISMAEMGKRIVDAVSNNIPLQFIPEEKFLMRKLHKQNIYVVSGKQIDYNALLVLYTAKNKYNYKFMELNSIHLHQATADFKLFTSKIDLFELRFIVDEPNFINIDITPIDELIKRFNVDKIQFFQYSRLPTINLPSDKIIIFYDNEIIKLTDILNMYEINKNIIVIPLVLNLPLDPLYKLNIVMNCSPADVILTDNHKIIPLSQKYYLLYAIDIPNAYYIKPDYITIPEKLTKDSIIPIEGWIKVLSLRGVI